MDLVRNKMWDNYKGILICLVVFAHFLFDFTDNPLIELIVLLIYSFHMPAFVFASGHFTHTGSRVKKLAAAFVIFQSVYLIIAFFLLGEIDILAPAYVCWYLLALIVWRLSARFIPRNKIIIPLLLVLSLLSGFITMIDNRFAATRILAFFVFFVAGNYLNEETVKKLRSKIIPVWGIVMLLAALCAFLASNYVFGYSLSDMAMMEYSSLSMLIGRAVLILIAFVSIFALLVIVPEKDGFISKIGRNSLPIFLVHRVITLVFSYVLKDVKEWWVILILSVPATVVTVILLGTDAAASFLDWILSGTEQKALKTRKAVIVSLVSMVMIIFVFTSVSGYMNRRDIEALDSEENTVTTQDPVYRVMSVSDEKRLDNAVKIIFAGDMILLEDQVRRGYDPYSDAYDFSSIFEYTKDTISSADYAVCVYEGPSAGGEMGYSTGNFGDDKRFVLNFPDEFAYAIADSGFDLVTTSNNHILDCGRDGALRTNEVLDDAGLVHIGTYSDKADRMENRVKIADVGGLRVAFLAYTYGTNYHTLDELFEGEYSSLTSVIVSPDNPYYERSLSMVEDDFDYCRSLDPDIIIVLPHFGTQFSNEPDEMQLVWKQNFIDLGADVILGDHAHTVQPAFMEETDGRMTLTAFCPGHFVDTYRDYGGEASVLVEVYIDPDTREIIAGGIVPMWITSPVDGNYRPMQIYDMVYDEDLSHILNVDDMERAKQANTFITEHTLGQIIDIDNIEPEYLFDENGFMRRQCEQLQVTGEMKGSELFEAITAADSVCFIGDDITCGSKNGGIPWYEPAASYIKGGITNISSSGWTTRDIINNADSIPNASLYVIAIGANDLRYDNPEVGAVNAEAYIKNMQEISNVLKSKNPQCRIFYVAPWISYDGDADSPLDINEINSRREEYSRELSAFVSAGENTNEYFIDPNAYIESVISKQIQSDYLIDWIHPNVTRGVRVYAEAVFFDNPG